MQTFVPKQNQPQKRDSSSLAWSNTASSGAAPSGADLHSHPILRLQRTIGNQAVQRMLQTNAEELEVGLSSTVSPLFGRGLSRTPIHSPAAAAIQTKLAVSKPGDIYEQQADRISEQVMRAPEGQLQRDCACGGGCLGRRCQTEQSGKNADSPGAKGPGPQRRSLTRQAQLHRNTLARIEAPPVPEDVGLEVSPQT